jgi:WD40 repeat protein
MTLSFSSFVIHVAARRKLIGSRSRWRGWLTAVILVGCAAIVIVAPALSADVDPSKMSADAIQALEQRLTDAGCYQGAIDGQMSGALDNAIKACPDQQPFLRIENGMHTAIINRIGVDSTCSLLATASDDKTVRLWSLPDGRPRDVVRLPIGDGDLGKVYSTAMSPDGRWLAAGGWDAGRKSSPTNSPSLVDLSNGAIRRFGAFENVLLDIAFSADGRRIAVGLGRNSGVRVLDGATGAGLLADRDYGGSVNSLAFAPDGGLIAVSDDGQLRRYRPDLKLTKKRAAPDGKDPIGVAVDPSGRRIAVGYDDNTSVSILDAKTLTPLGKAQTSDVSNGELSSVAWSRDGATFVAGGIASEQFADQWRRFLRRSDATGRRKGKDVAASDNTINDIKACGDSFAFAAQDPAFGLLSAQGVATTLQGPRSADMRGKLGAAFALSPDAASARFGLGVAEAEPILFDLAAASLTDSTTLPPKFLNAKIDGLLVTDWKYNTAPKFNGTKLALDDYERSHALAVRGDASGFALGTSYWVRAYDAKGEERWRHGSQGRSWGVDFSADGAILAVAYDDGTIRWLRWSDGAELLALFVEPQSRKWVAWTPSGYYMASAGAEDLIGGHVNRGWAQQADFFPASQFRVNYNRPDIVRLVLKTLDEAEAVRQANQTADRAVPTKPLSASLQPVVTIASPTGAHFSGDSVEVAYTLRSSSGLPIDRLEAFADGEKVPVAGFNPTSAREAQGHVVVTVPRKNTQVSLITYSGDLPSAPVTVSLIYDGPASADLLKPKLYALLVGVTGYDNPDYNNIHFSAHDADDLAKALMAQKGGLYADVQVRIINNRSRADADPTRSNVENGHYWLQNSATNRDLAVVFLYGHGFLGPVDGFNQHQPAGKTDDG